MAQTQRIVVIDDERDHLDSLVEEVKGFGIPCLPIHFTGEPAEVSECPGVRVIFADLHLIAGVVSDHKKDFSVIGSLLEDRIKPTGPYLLLLWTQYPEQAADLETFLERLQGVAKPVSVLALSKNDFLDGKGGVKSEAELIDAIDSLASGWLDTEGAVGLQGGWGSLDDQEVDDMIEEIYAARRRDKGRTVELDD